MKKQCLLEENLLLGGLLSSSSFSEIYIFVIQHTHKLFSQDQRFFGKSSNYSDKPFYFGSPQLLLQLLITITLSSTSHIVFVSKKKQSKSFFFLQRNHKLNLNNNVLRISPHHFAHCNYYLCSTKLNTERSSRSPANKLSPLKLTGKIRKKKVRVC